MAPSPAPQASKEPQARKRAGRTNGGVKIAGTIIPYDDDVDLSNQATPTPLFPRYNPPPPAPLSATEKAQVSSFLSLRSRIHEGPFYTIIDNTSSRISKTSKPSAANFDPFEGMPSYSQKYIKKRRRLPKLSARPYVLKYFPHELYPVLDPTNYKSSSLNTTVERRTVPRRSTVTKEGAGAGVTSGDEEEAAEKDPDEEAMNAAVDDEFDEDEDDDAGGDYNAEQYFDDGGDDAGEDGDGDEGGGGGGYY
ncbi:MAG: hypothetical protein Q9221_001480 [Calogaya cf. arnoldii]